MSLPVAEPLTAASRLEVAQRCTGIADRVEPRYRNGSRSYSCYGHVAKLWQAAWDGACVALGGDPLDFVRKPDRDQ